MEGVKLEKGSKAGEAERKHAVEAPSRVELVRACTEYLEGCDLEKTSSKSVRRHLEGVFGVDLKEFKDAINDEIGRFLEESVAGRGGGASGSGRGGKEGGSGFRRLKPSKLSASLAAFVGADEMPRTEVVRRVWAHIKANGLQDPTDKRVILVDDKLGTFLAEPVTAFSLNKQLAAHVLELNMDAEPWLVPKKDKEYGADNSVSEKAKGKRSAKSASVTRAPKRQRADAVPPEKVRASRGPRGSEVPKWLLEQIEASESVDKKPAAKKHRGGFAKPCKLSSELSTFMLSHEWKCLKGLAEDGGDVDSGQVSRGQVVKCIWEYIRDNDLQDPSNKKMIRVDAELGMFLAEPVTAFSMNKQLTKHIFSDNQV